MTDYKKLVKELRGCKDMDYCTDCPRMANGYVEFCNIKDDAAAVIEALLSFAHYVADKVTMSDEDWEDYHDAFTEVACRKLVKLGVISIEDGMYVYKRDEPQEVQDGQA